MPPEDNAPAPDTSVTPPATPPAASDGNPAWLPDRLKQAQEARDKAWLKDLGVDSPDLAKKLVAEGRAAAEAKKTAEERHRETETALTTTRAELAAYKTAIDARAADEFSRLSKEQQDAVTAIAGDDSAQRLKTIAALTPTWKAEPAAPAASAKPPVAAPASTAPAKKDPPTTGTKPEGDANAEYERLSAINPLVAAQFYLDNYSAISKAREQQS